MGSLLIVDDEPDILESLEEMFKYESGLEIDVYAAKSASVAVRLLEKIKFDVVMTDIKMPGMNGIELFRLIKENWPKCRVIFLTGFRDFDNLYEISNYKDVRYLLKSEENEVLISAVKDAFDEIERMMLSEKQERVHLSEIRKAQLVLRKNVMKEYFRNASNSNLTQEDLEQIQIPVQMEDYLFIFLLRIDGEKRIIGYEEEFERERLLCEIIDEFLPPRFRFYLYYDANGYYLLFLQPVHFQEESLSARLWKRLYTNLAGAMEYVQEKAYLTASLSISFITCDERCYLKDGQIYLNRLKQVANSKAKNCMQRFILAESKPEGNTIIETEMPVNFQMKIKSLENNLDVGKFSDFSEELQQLTILLSKMGEDKVTERAELYYSIAIVLLRFINIKHIRNKIDIDIPLDKLICIEKHKNADEAADYLCSVGNSIVDEMDIKSRSKSNDVLEKVIIYINNHLEEDLTLTRLSEISYLNASYLSRIFKQNYGCNITEYISNVRLEKGKKLLSGTSYKISEISARVGYLTVPSFNRVFKKAIGISPLEYRARYGEKNGEL